MAEAVSVTGKRLKRQIYVVDGVARVPLTKGFEALIDIDDVDKASGKNWHVKIGKGGLPYAARDVSSATKRRFEYLHKVVVSAPEGLLVDHRDGNTLDCRKSNLRPATKQQNQTNQKTRSDNSSGYKGVSWAKREKRWFAKITVNGKQKGLGYFNSAEEAYLAYCKAAIDLHGEFARFDRKLSEQVYIFRWNRCGRKGQRYRDFARGTMNSVGLEFEDGFTMVSSGNALRRA